MVHDPSFDWDRYVEDQEAAMEAQPAFVQVGAHAFNVERIELIVFHPDESATVVMASGRLVDLDKDDIGRLLTALWNYEVVTEPGPATKRAVAAARQYWERREAEADELHVAADDLVLGDPWEEPPVW